MGNWEARVAELGIAIPPPLPPGALYSSVVVDAGLAYVSGIVAVEGEPPRLAHAGLVGDDLDVEAGRASARSAMLRILGNLRGAVESLDRVARFVRLTGYVRAVPGFAQSPAVVDGASELLLEIFGRDLLPARTAFGVSALPGGASVELDAVVRLEGG